MLGIRPLDTLHWSWRDAGLGLLAILPPLALLGVCLRWPVGPLGELVRVVDGLLVPLFRDWRLADFALVSVLAGVGEEMLFRGVIQPAVAEAVGGGWGIAVGLAASALLFGLAHPITPAYALLAGLIGLYLGGVWLVSGNLLVPVVAHAGYDFVALIWLIRIRR